MSTPLIIAVVSAGLLIWLILEVVTAPELPNDSPDEIADGDDLRLAELCRRALNTPSHEAEYDV